MWRALCLGLASAVVLVAGCSTPGEPIVRLATSRNVSARIEHRAPKITRADLIEGKLAIVGISGLGRDELDCAVDISELLSRYLDESIPMLDVMLLPEVRLTVGQESHHALIAYVGESLGPEQADFARMAAVGAQARFWLWLHLNGCSIDNSESQEVAETTEQVTDSEGNSYTQTSFAGYNSTRTVTQDVRALIFIYDSISQLPVWIAQGSYFASTDRTAFSSVFRPPYPEWPGGTGLVEPLARIALKTIEKIPEKR